MKKINVACVCSSSVLSEFVGLASRSTIQSVITAILAFSKGVLGISG